MQISRRNVHGAEDNGRKEARPCRYACRLVTVEESHPLTSAHTCEVTFSRKAVLKPMPHPRIMREVKLYPVAASSVFIRNCPPCYPIPRICAHDGNLAKRTQLLFPYPVAESELLAVVAHHAHRRDVELSRPV